MSAGRVIVGVDGSESSKEALRWAAEYAGAVGAPLEALTVWDMPITFGWVASLEEDDPEQGALDALDALVRDVLGEDAQVTTKVERGHAAFVLVTASKRAGLLVVGSRGRGGFTGMLIGSVSQYCVQHATCPVVVFREHRG